MKLGPAHEWTFSAWNAFQRGSAVNRQVIRQAAFMRNLQVEMISRSFYVISDGLREIGFWNTMPEATTLVLRKVSVSKPLTKAMLERAGVRVPSGKLFSQRHPTAAWRFAKTIGPPVVVKPTSGSGGLGVTSDISTEDHFRLAWKSAQRVTTDRIIVEKYVPGKDFRLYVVGDRLVAAARRIPAYIEGDGQSSISELVSQKNQARRSNPYVGGKQMKLIPGMLHNLREIGLAPDAVLETGRRVTLHPVANIGAGGESVDVTTNVHPDFGLIAIKACKALPGAIHAGIDLLVDDISAPAAGQEWAICEINTNPDIAMHHFPVVGMPRDAAGALVEYLFPGARICEPSEHKRTHAVVSGTVIRTGFRQWIWRRANLRGLTGWVRNRADGTVEAVFCGASNAVDDMIDICRTGPARAVVEDVTVEPSTDETIDDFNIRGDAGGVPLRDLVREGAPNVRITGLAADSRSVKSGMLFFCIPGRRARDRARRAVARGAAALIVERPLGLGVPEVVVPSTRAAIAPAAARFFGDPTAELKLVGVTGTNGKTTTAFLVRSLLEATGCPCGLLGTVTTLKGGVEQRGVRTTPGAIKLQRAFRAMLEAGDRACAMEVTSRALERHRADAIHWDAAVFTNLTRDHLDIHATMEKYFSAKRRLFLASPRASIVNVDDPYGRRLAGEIPGALRFAIDHPADYRATELKTDWTGTRFRLQGPDVDLYLRSPLLGRFNVYNVLGAAIAALALGVHGEDIAAALAAARRIPGRLEPVDEGQDFAVLVDYAHTPDALDNVLRTARELAQARVVVVFGCSGNRDRGKRPLMGEIATQLADQAIITSANPRSEDPEAIIAKIMAGAGVGAKAIVDRGAAITSAIELAEPGDVVVIAGKGHERGQEFGGGRRVPFHDATVARKALRAAALSR